MSCVVRESSCPQTNVDAAREEAGFELWRSGCPQVRDAAHDAEENANTREHLPVGHPAGACASQRAIASGRRRAELDETCGVSHAAAGCRTKSHRAAGEPCGRQRGPGEPVERTQILGEMPDRLKTQLHCQRCSQCAAHLAGISKKMYVMKNTQVICPRQR